MKRHAEGDLPSASVLYNVFNGFFAPSGIDIEDACEMFHVLGEGHRDMLFRGLKCLFRTGAPVTAPLVEEAKVCTQAVLSYMSIFCRKGTPTTTTVKV